MRHQGVCGKYFPILIGGMAVSHLLPFLVPALGVVRWVLFTACALGVIVRYWISARKNRPICFVTSALTIMAAIFIGSSIWSPLPVETFVRAWMFLLLVGVLVVVQRRLGQSLDPRRIANWILVWGMGVLGGGVILLVIGRETVPVSGEKLFLAGRYAGLLTNPNQVALCAVIVGPFAYARFLAERKIGPAIVLLFSLVTVFLSGSRAGLISFMVGLSVVTWFFVKSRGYLARWTTALVILGVVAYLGSGFGAQQVQSIVLRGQTVEDNNRIGRWQLGLQSIQKNALLGQGYGIGGVDSYADLTGPGYVRGYALHNSYLQVWQEAGIVSLVTALLICIGIVARVSLASLQIRFDADFSAFAGVSVAGLISAAFESWLFAPGNPVTLLYWLTVVAMWAISTDAYYAYQSRKRYFSRIHQVLRVQPIIKHS